MEKEILTPIPSPTAKIRKRKLLSDPNRIWVKCQTCQEPGNCENMIYAKRPFKDSEDKILFGCFEGVYFCGVECKDKLVAS